MARVEETKNGGKKAAVYEELAAFALLAVMVLWFAGEIVWGGGIPFYRDLAPYFYPLRWNLAQSLRSGELPLWNRHVAMGFPLAANIQAGAFYPPHLLFLVLPFFAAIRVLFVFHFLVAAWGSYALCRRWGYPGYLAMLGAVLFTFGGAIVSLTNLLDHFQTAVWLPVALLFAERSLGGRSWKDFCLFTLAALLQFLAGSPEIYAMSQALVLLDGFWLKATQQRELSYRRFLSVILGANALVAALAAVQLLPTLELFFNSWRSETLPYAKGVAWSFSPLRLVNFIFLDKEPNPFAFNGLNLFFGLDRPLFISLYLGALVLPGICLWFFTSSLKEKSCLLGVSLIVLLLALGGYTPVYPFLYRHLPLLRLIRFPEKYLFVVSAIFLLMALRGFFRFLSQGPGLSRVAWLAAVIVPLLAYVLPYLFFRLNLEGLVRLIAEARHGLPFETSTLQLSAAAILVYLERQILITAGFAALLLLFKSGRIRAGLFEILLVALAFFDLASAHRAYLFPLSPGVVFRNPPIVGAAAEEPSRLFYIHDLSNLHPSSYRFSPRPFGETVASVFATLMPNTGVFLGFDYMQELDALGRKPYEWFLEVANGLPPQGLYRLFGALNVGRIISLQPLPLGGITLLRYFPDYPVWLYRIDRPAPRAYVVAKIVVAASPRESLIRLASAEFDPFKEVLLEEPLSVPAQANFHAAAEILKYTNQLVTVRAELNGPGILVLADSFYPGWCVYVDGAKGKILRANFFFRGVLLAPGKHRVDFRYQPWWLPVGLSVSLAAVGLLLVFPLFRFFRGRRVDNAG